MLNDKEIKEVQHLVRELKGKYLKLERTRFKDAQIRRNPSYAIFQDEKLALIAEPRLEQHTRLTLSRIRRRLKQLKKKANK